MGGNLADWVTAVLGAPCHHSCSQAFPPASLPLLPQGLPGAGNTAFHREPKQEPPQQRTDTGARVVGGQFWGPWFPGGICSLQGWGPVSVLAGGSLNPEYQSGPVVPAVDADGQASDAPDTAGPHVPDRGASAGYR